MSNSAKFAPTVEGSANAWATVSAGAIIQDSFNISSLIDQATGLFLYNFSNNMANINYSFSGNGGGAFSPIICFAIVLGSGDLNVDSVRVRGKESGTSTFTDVAQGIIVIGDMA